MSSVVPEGAVVRLGNRVLVAGAGALGSVFGGFLRKHGCEVSFLGRARHLSAVRDGGLAIGGIWGEHHVAGISTATDVANLRGPFDIILLSVKSFDTVSVARSIAPLLADDGWMVSLQNGLGNVEAVEESVGAERTLGARVIFGAVLSKPGRVAVTVFADPTAIGSLDSKALPRREQAARSIAATVRSAGVPAEYTPDLPSKLWAKIFYNSALNPLGALLDVHYGRLPEDENSRSIMDDTIREAFAVAVADGVRLPWPSADAYLEEFYGRLVPSTYDHRSSMLQDLERGRPTEIGAINGEICRRGDRLRVATPINRTLTRLIRLAETRGVESGG